MLDNWADSSLHLLLLKSSMNWISEGRRRRRRSRRLNERTNSIEFERAKKFLFEVFKFVTFDLDFHISLDSQIIELVNKQNWCRPVWPDSHWARFFWKVLAANVPTEKQPRYLATFRINILFNLKILWLLFGQLWEQLGYFLYQHQVTLMPPESWNSFELTRANVFKYLKTRIQFRNGVTKCWNKK